ncbi:phage tail assembly chaperone [Pseudodesulfovibrio karagichevae]|uniref:Phage tail assembly chaperone n=1 Tax=Pseudodesulfovibrio karagichevae TaxID=3239305 RepID=A0ABV4K1C9_9BACT
MQQYRYTDATTGAARQVIHNGQVYPASYLTRRTAESEAAWIERIAVIGVTPVKYEPWTGDPNTQSKGDPVETLTDGWLVIGYPNTTDKTPYYNKATRELMYVAEGQTVPDTYTALEPTYDLYSTWDEVAGEWILDTERKAANERAERDTRMEAARWRIERYQSEVRLGRTPTDDIAELDTYFQALRDVPSQPGFPASVEWPTEPENN